MGMTLFSMFFGAGNLIFPPFLGAMAGRYTWTAMAGFVLTAVGFPILGVAAVAESGGLTALGSRVHPRFAFVFTLLIYLSIGPCLAIPRTASTSFEMAVKPFVEAGAGVQLLYSVVFFGIAFLVALKPDRLTQRLGKILPLPADVDCDFIPGMSDPSCGRLWDPCGAVCHRSVF